MQIYAQQKTGPIYELKDVSITGSVEVKIHEPTLRDLLRRRSLAIKDNEISYIDRQISYEEDMAYATRIFVGKLYTRSLLYTKLKSIYLVGNETVYRWGDVVIYENEPDLIHILEDDLHTYTLRLARPRETTLHAFRRLLRIQERHYAV